MEPAAPLLAHRCLLRRLTLLACAERFQLFHPLELGRELFPAFFKLLQLRLTELCARLLVAAELEQGLGEAKAGEVWNRPATGRQFRLARLLRHLKGVPHLLRSLFPVALLSGGEPFVEVGGRPALQLLAAARETWHY